MERLKLRINIGSREENIVFVVVENASPWIIGGIDLLRRFDIKLMKVIGNNIQNASEYNNMEICNIEAKFGKRTSDELRFKRAIELIGLRCDNKLYGVIKKMPKYL